MPVEVMILFMIVAAGVAMYYYVQARTQKNLYEDLDSLVETYKEDIQVLETEVSYWKSKFQETSKSKKSVRKNKTK